MHCEKHLAFLICDQIMLDARPKHEQVPCPQSMRLTFSGDLEMAFQDVNGDDSLGAVRWQTSEVAEYEKCHCRRILLIQSDLSVTFFAGLEFFLEFQGDGIEVERKLWRGKS